MSKNNIVRQKLKLFFRTFVGIITEQHTYILCKINTFCEASKKETYQFEPITISCSVNERFDSVLTKYQYGIALLMPSATLWYSNATMLLSDLEKYQTDLDSNHFE